MLRDFGSEESGQVELWCHFGKNSPLPKKTIEGLHPEVLAHQSHQPSVNQGTTPPDIDPEKWWLEDQFQFNFKHMVTFNFSKVHVKLRCGKEIVLPLGLASRLKARLILAGPEIDCCKKPFGTWIAYVRGPPQSISYGKAYHKNKHAPWIAMTFHDCTMN